jgi:hypothetical protein
MIGSSHTTVKNVSAPAITAAAEQAGRHRGAGAAHSRRGGDQDSHDPMVTPAVVTAR